MLFIKLIHECFASLYVGASNACSILGGQKMETLELEL